ncbi:MAG: hypothetical protein AAGB24_11100 [Bacteroidota bacterium]
MKRSTGKKWHDRWSGTGATSGQMTHQLGTNVAHEGIKVGHPITIKKAMLLYS